MTMNEISYTISFLVSFQFFIYIWTVKSNITMFISKRSYFYLTSLFIYFIIIITLHRLLFVPQFNFNINNAYQSKYSYLALIVDDRTTHQVINAILNILKYLPNDWKIQMIIPVENWSFYNSSSLSSLIQNNRIFFTPLELPRTDFSGHEYINLILTSASFWRQVEGEKVLYFQFDSVICSNSSYKLTDFLDYDYIGAPWSTGGCCNGGFSIRSRTKMIELFENFPIRYQLHVTNEDVWIYRHLAQVNGRIAPNSLAKQFSVESIYFPRPFAVHNPNLGRLGAENMKRLCDYCPEIRTITHHCK